MWQQNMLSGYVTQVCISHSMQDFQAAASVVVFTLGLQKLCATRSCALLISGQQKCSGTVETFCHTFLELDEVCALIANVQQITPDFKTRVSSVKLTNILNSDVVTHLLRDSQT